MAKDSGPKIKPVSTPKMPKAPTVQGISRMALPPGTGAMVKNPLIPSKGKKGKLNG